MTRFFAAVLIAGSLAAPALAQDRRVVIINESSVPIVGFYGVTRTDNSWRENVLGGDTLDPGEAMQVNFNDGSGECMFKFRAVFSDGDELVDKNMNVCQLSDHTYTD